MALNQELAVRMLHQARGFRATSVILHEKVHIAREPLFFPSYASICTLTIELYFKAVFYIENQKQAAKTHEVDRLFLSLDKPTQSAIEVLYKEISPKDRIPLQTLLQGSSRAFEEYRYFHESHKSGGYHLTYEVIEATVAYLRKTVPALMKSADGVVLALSDDPK